MFYTILNNDGEFAYDSPAESLQECKDDVLSDFRNDECDEGSKFTIYKLVPVLKVSPYREDRLKVQKIEGKK
jgi:hypothetical protein